MSFFWFWIILFNCCWLLAAEFKIELAAATEPDPVRYKNAAAWFLFVREILDQKFFKIVLNSHLLLLLLLLLSIRGLLDSGRGQIVSHHAWDW